MKKQKYITIISFVFSILVCMNINSASATKIYVDPPNVDPSLISGNTFKIDVMIDDVSNLYAFQFNLKYDPSILKATDVSVAPFLNKPRRIIMSEVNEKAGIVTIAFTSEYPAEPKSGSGKLATITFKIVRNGKCNLDLYDTILTDDNFPIPNKISHEVIDGAFNIPFTSLTTAMSTTTFIPSEIERDCGNRGNGAACLKKEYCDSPLQDCCDNACKLVGFDRGICEERYKECREDECCCYCFNGETPPSSTTTTPKTTTTIKPGMTTTTKITTTTSTPKILCWKPGEDGSEKLMDCCPKDYSKKGTFCDDSACCPGLKCGGSVGSRKCTGEALTTTTTTTGSTTTTTRITTTTTKITTSTTTSSSTSTTTTAPPSQASGTIAVDKVTGSYCPGSFDVNVWALNVNSPGLFSYQFELSYGKDNLIATNAIIPPGHFLTPNDPRNIITVDSGTINQDEGKVSFAVTLLGSEYGKINSGVLTRITFEVIDNKCIGNNRCGLVISSNPIFVDPYGKKFSNVNVENGYFENTCGGSTTTTTTGSTTTTTTTASSTTTTTGSTTTSTTTSSTTSTSTTTTSTTSTTTTAPPSYCDQYDKGYLDNDKNSPYQCSGYEYNYLWYSSAKQMRDYFLKDSECDCRVTFDSYIIGVMSNSECREDLNHDGQINIIDIANVAIAFESYPGKTNWNPDADLDINGEIDIIDLSLVAKKFDQTCQPGVYDNEKINVIIKVNNTGDNDQTSPFIGVEFWKVHDYTRPNKDEKGVKAWVNIKDKTHGCDIAGCECTSVYTEFKKGQIITINCQIPASRWGPTTGNERIMVWVHERDLTQDVGNNGNYGNDWWTDALSSREPADGKKPEVAKIIIKSSGIRSKETVPLSIILRNTLIQLFQRIFGLHKTYPTGNMISEL